MFGLLSMHGWGSHLGTHSMLVTPQGANVINASSGLGTDGHSASAASELAASKQIVADHPAGMDSDEPDGESGAALLGLCLAVLTGLLLGIALLLARRGFRISGTLLPVWQHRHLIRRDHDPPTLSMLCVIRC